MGEAFGAAYRQATPAEKFEAQVEANYTNRVWQAPVWISLGVYRDEKSRMPEIEDIMSAAVAVHHIHLVGASLGLACKWSSGFTTIHPCVAEVAGLTPPSRMLGVFYVGKPTVAWPNGSRRPLGEKVQWID